MCYKDSPVLVPPFCCRQNHTDAIQMSMIYCNVTFWCEMEPFFAIQNNNATRCQIQSKEVLGSVSIEKAILNSVLLLLQGGRRSTIFFPNKPLGGKV